MFLFVVGIILLLIGVGLIIVGPVKVDEGTRDELTLPLRGVGIFVLALAGVALIWSASYSQSTGEAVLIKSPSGSVVDVDTTSGWGFTAPWNSTSTWDLRNQNVIFKGDGSDVDDKEVKLGLDGGANAYLDQVVTYNIPADRDTIESIYNRYRSQGDFEKQGLIPATRSNTQDAAGAYEPYTVKQRRTELNQDVTANIGERFEELGAELVTVEFTDLRLDDDTEARVREVVNRQAEVEASNADLEAARIRSEVVREEAKAEADADQIARCGATTEQVTREVSGREIETTVITPKFGAACENALNEQVLLNKWIETIGANENAIIVPMELESILNLGSTGQPAG